MEKSTVLVVPAGTEIGLEVRESLALSKHWRVVAANSWRDHSQVVFHEAVFDLPFAHDPTFVDAVTTVVEEVGADFVVPTHDDAVFALAGANLAGATFVGPDPALAEILRFKSRTYAALRHIVPCPRQYDRQSVQRAVLPLFAKPDRGQGSRGARKIATEHDLAAALAEPPGLVFLEYLPDEEYTIDCFTTAKGVVAYVGSRLRVRVSNGISVRAVEVRDDRFTAMAEAISAVLAIRGAWFFQAKVAASGELKLLEVANRISGTMGFQRERGINLIEAWLHDLKGRDITFLPWEFGPVVLDRALAGRAMWDYRPETIYVDFDDTLILPGGQLNYHLVGLLFGCKANLGCRVILVSRHGAELGPALRRLALTELFDEVRHLTAGEPKSDAIEPGAAIFIDDSFAERTEVWRVRRIPTFPAEAMACLEGLNHRALGDAADQTDGLRATTV